MATLVLLSISLALGSNAAVGFQGKWIAMRDKEGIGPVGRRPEPARKPVITVMSVELSALSSVELRPLAKLSCSSWLR